MRVWPTFFFMQKWFFIGFICKTKHYTLYDESVILFLVKVLWLASLTTFKDSGSPNGELNTCDFKHHCRLPPSANYDLQMYFECLDNWLACTEIYRQTLWNMEVALSPYIHKQFCIASSCLCCVLCPVIGRKFSHRGSVQWDPSGKTMSLTVAL